jgi:uncharacterized damage-inducible protein DinB
MTVQEFKLLFAFNAWASNRIFEALEAMPETDVFKDMKTSHGSIHNTMVHLVGAERIWLSRWMGDPSAAALRAGDVPTLRAVRDTWNTVGMDTAKFVAGLSDRKLSERFEMNTMKGEVLSQVYWHAMLHVIDHSTYHRAQVIAMMRQLGVVPPSTGMIGFFRETAKLGKS